MKSLLTFASILGIVAAMLTLAGMDANAQQSGARNSNASTAAARRSRLGRQNRARARARQRRAAARARRFPNAGDNWRQRAFEGGS